MFKMFHWLVGEDFEHKTIKFPIYFNGENASYYCACVKEVNESHGKCQKKGFQSIQPNFGFLHQISILSAAQSSYRKAFWQTEKPRLSHISKSFFVKPQSTRWEPRAAYPILCGHCDNYPKHSPKPKACNMTTNHQNI